MRYKIYVYHNCIYWTKNNKVHRLEGPAFVNSNDCRLWYNNGGYHRLNGPAVELANGSKYWHINGKKYSQKYFNKKIKSGKK